jgi:hypothetical protein
LLFQPFTICKSDGYPRFSVVHSIRFYAGSASTMPTHKFHVGQLVQLIPSISRNVPGGSYEIIKKLPENRGKFEYRIKSMNERYERVVRESELQGVSIDF